MEVPRNLNRLVGRALLNAPIERVLYGSTHVEELNLGVERLHLG